MDCKMSLWEDESERVRVRVKCMDQFRFCDIELAEFTTETFARDGRCIYLFIRVQIV